MSEPATEKPASLPPLESFPKVGFCGVAGCGLPVYETPFGTVCRNKHGGAPVLNEPPRNDIPKVLVKETIKAPAKEARKPVDTPKTEVKQSVQKPANMPADDGGKPEEKFDFSKIDPKKDWECFGQIEPAHPECKGCPFRTECATEAGIQL